MRLPRRYRNPDTFDWHDPRVQEAADMFEAFHGVPPEYADEFEVPDYPEVAFVLGRAYEISYIPERGRRKGDIYNHHWGDTGTQILPNKPLLVARPNGEVFLVPDRSTYRVTHRGIVG